MLAKTRRWHFPSWITSISTNFSILGCVRCPSFLLHTKTMGPSQYHSWSCLAWPRDVVCSVTATSQVHNAMALKVSGQFRGVFRAQEWSITTRLSAQCRFDCTLFAYQSRISRFRIFYLPSCGNKSGGAFDDHQHQSSHRIEDRHQWTLSPSRDLESHPRVHRNSSQNRKSSRALLKAFKSPVVLPCLAILTCSLQTKLEFLRNSYHNIHPDKDIWSPLEPHILKESLTLVHLPCPPAPSESSVCISKPRSSPERYRT